MPNGADELDNKGCAYGRQLHNKVEEESGDVEEVKNLVYKLIWAIGGFMSASIFLLVTILVKLL